MPGTTPMIEREIKLRYLTVADARSAVLAAGATPLRSRRLQADALLDTDDDALQRRRCVLRMRRDSDHCVLTFKGPVRPGSMKVRDEYESTVGDGEVMLRVLEQLGFRVSFRYEKYREEYSAKDVTVAVDETPVGTFVEIEGSETGILAVSAALGRSPADFVLESYRALFLRYRDAFGLTGPDMVFGAE